VRSSALSPKSVIPLIASASVTPRVLNKPPGLFASDGRGARKLRADCWYVNSRSLPEGEVEAVMEPRLREERLLTALLEWVYRPLYLGETATRGVRAAACTCTCARVCAGGGGGKKGEV
jgi:hypothetical protein